MCRSGLAGGGRGEPCPALGGPGAPFTRAPLVHREVVGLSCIRPCHTSLINCVTRVQPAVLCPAPDYSSPKKIIYN